MGRVLCWRAATRSTTASSPGRSSRRQSVTPPPARPCSCLRSHGLVEGRGQGTRRGYSGLTVSWEDPRRNSYQSDDRNYIYFAAARFAVVRQLVEQVRSAVLVVDTDGLVVRSLGEPFACFAGHDVGPIPGIVIRRRAQSSLAANASISRVTSVMRCSRRARSSNRSASSRPPVVSGR